MSDGRHTVEGRRATERRASTEVGDGRARRGLLDRVGRWTALNPLKVLAVWALLLVLAVISAGTFASRISSQNNAVDGSGSVRAADLIEQAFPDAPAERDFAVLSSGSLTAQDPDFRAHVEKVVARYRGATAVREVTSPYAETGSLVSRDGHTALVPVALEGDTKELRDAAAPLVKIAEGLTTDRIQVYFTGESPLAAAAITQAGEDLGRAETIGLPVAAIILLIAFGSAVAAAIPLALGVTAILASFGALGVLAYTLQFSTITRSAVTMLAIALGIDYSLFIVTRFREELAARGAAVRAGRGATPAERAAARAERADAIGRSMSTAGRAVIFSGSTVMISLAGLFLVRSPGLRAMAVGMMVGVLAMLALATTLLPAVLGLLGTRVNSLALPWARASLAQPHPERSGWARLTAVVMRRPVLVALGVTALLGALALPTFGLVYGVDTGAGAVKDSAAGRGLTAVSGSFAPGLIAPVSVVTTGGEALSDTQLDALAEFTRRASTDSRVAAVTSVTAVLDQRAGGHTSGHLWQAAGQAPDAFGALVNKAMDTTVVTIYPKQAADSTQTQDLVTHLRAEVDRQLTPAGLTTHVGGEPAQIADITAENSRSTPLVIGAVLAASWLLLLLVFRSLVLPFQAIVMNLLSVGAAFGAVILVFQEGHGASLLDVDRTGFIQVMLPLLTFAVAFGLSMDYEVFLLSRMREEWDRTGDNTTAVRLGITHTARVITSAALIMVAVFAAFMLANMLETKQLGFMLAVAVLIDATVVRMLLVPAVMRLLGRWNWWLPGWLGRILPSTRIH